ncbi:MAG: TonB C-terminal domain-containing protein [Deltaproteobacteria bacterium]|nr:TonB C-terminal domain-containing protein [Deltaproteobacteria bacterium]
MSPFSDAPSESDEFLTIERYTEELWKKPIILAICIHLLVIVLMLLPASFFKFERNNEEIYTVNLFEMSEPGPAKQEAPPAPPAPPEIKKPKEVPPPEVKEVEPPPVKEPPAVVEKIAPAPETISTSTGEVVSLKPRQVKKEIKPKKEVKPDKNQDVKIDQALNRIKNQLNKKQAEQKAKEAQASATAAVDNALAKIRDSIHARRTAPPSSSTQSTTGAGATGGGSAKLDAALRLYYIAVSQKIHEHWKLPETQDWKKDLKAVVVVKVQRDGEVTDHFFEVKSDNSIFNQFVEKTLKESFPLPPFPENLDESELEIGLVFHPSGLE